MSVIICSVLSRCVSIALFKFSFSSCLGARWRIDRLLAACTFDRLVVLWVGFGMVVRLVQYLANRSLWADEAVLALNIVNRSYLQLLQPLDYDQAAPIGFLWVEKFAVEVLGNCEYALRLFPVFASILAGIWFYQIAIALISKKAVPIALALFASLEYLVYYAAEVKQYSTDVAIALLLMGMMLRLMPLERLDRRQIIEAILVGSLSIWFAHPAVFILASLGLLVGLASRGLKRLQLGGIYLTWLLSFALFYGLSIVAISQNQTLKQSWQGKGSFPESLWDGAWLFDRLSRFFANPLGFEKVFFADLAIGFCLLGCWALWQARRRSLAILLAPIGCTLGAAYIHQYPFQSRLVLFLTPLAILLISEGTVFLWNKAAQSRQFWLKLLGAIAISLLMLPPLIDSSQLLVRPLQLEEIKPVIEYVRTRQQPGDILYVFQRGEYQFKYYADRYGYQPSDYQIGVDDLDDGEKVSPEEWRRYQQDFDRLRGYPRVWMLFSHTDGTKQEEEMVLSYLDRIGTKIERFSATGAFVYLYDFK
jgi:hypothetical protein